MFEDERVVEFSLSPPFRAPRIKQVRRESVIVREIMKGLKAHYGAEAVKNHGSIYSKRARPDIEVLISFPLLPYAVLFVIEVKRPGEKPTVQQAERIVKYRQQGAVAFAADNFADVWTQIDDVRISIERQFKGGDL